MSSNKQIPVHAMMVIEVMGRPQEHLIETLKKMGEDVHAEKDTEVVEKKIAEPTLVKDQKDLFTAFIELEVKTASVLQLFVLMFKYMPAHVEILEPEQIALSNHDLTDTLNEVTRRLHKYDELARIVQMDKQILENKLKKLTEEKT